MRDLWGFCFFAFGAIVILKLSRGNARLRNLLFVAFIVRAFFALVHYYVIPLPDSQADAVSFEVTAARWAQAGFWEVLGRFSTGSQLYPWVIAMFYSAFGRNPLMAQAVNVILGTLIIYNVFWIAFLLWGKKHAYCSAWCATLFPTLVLYSAITMRETMIVFPLTLGTLYFVRWLKEDRLTDFLVAIFMYGLSAAFHTGMLPAIFVAGFAALRRLLDALYFARTRVVVTRVIAACCLFLVIFAILFTGWGLSKVGRIMESGDFVGSIALQQARAARSRAAYLHNLQPGNFLELILQVPVRIVYFLFMPFPWLVSSLADLLGLIIAGCNFVVTLLVISSLVRILERKESRWVFWTLLFLLITFSIGTSNYGTAIRHSAKLVPLALAVARIPRVRIWI